MSADKPGDHSFFVFPKWRREEPWCWAHQGSSQPQKQEATLGFKKEAEALFLPTGLQLRLAASLLIPHLVSEPQEPLL